MQMNKDRGVGRLKRVVAQAAAAAGYEIRPLRQTTHHLDLNGGQHGLLQRLIEQRGVTHVVDVGANVGIYAQELRRAGFPGRIDSYEPAVASYRQAAERMGGDPLWFGHQSAVGAVAGTATLHHFPGRDEVFNSLHGPTDAGRATFGGLTATSFEVVEEETVPVVRLDDEGLPNCGPLMLKIDTQGHDWAVLDGATQVLEQAVVLSLELSIVPMYDASVPIEDTLAQLRDRGWLLAGFEPVCMASDPLVIGEADGFFVRPLAR